MKLRNIVVALGRFELSSAGPKPANALRLFTNKTILKIQSILFQYISGKYAISSNRNGIQTKNQKRVSKLGSWEILEDEKMDKEILNKTKLKVNNSFFHIVDLFVV